MRTEKDNKKVMIMGEEFKVEIITKDTDKTMLNEGWIAYCGRYDHRIVFELDRHKQDEGEKETMRHEIIHAYLGQAGLIKYNNDEALVTALSVLIPKMNKTFKELDCLE